MLPPISMSQLFWRLVGASFDLGRSERNLPTLPSQPLPLLVPRLKVLLANLDGRGTLALGTVGL